MQKQQKRAKALRRGCLDLGLAFLFLVLAAGQPALAANPQPGYTERVTVVNNCGSDVWMWSIPPGPDLAEEQNQYWEPPINPGERICLGGSGVTCTGTGSRDYHWKVVIPQGSSQSLNIPDVGAASFKIYFKMGCVAGESPFTNFGDCQIGGAFGSTILGGDLLGSQTWFEGTWGCNPALDQSTCAVNPSDPSKKLNNLDNFDISFVDGYTVPIKMTLGDGEAVSHNCIVGETTPWDGIDDNGFMDIYSCPKEDGNSLWTRDAAVKAVLNGTGLDLTTRNPTTHTPMHCTAPYAWFTTTTLGQSVTGATRPLTGSDDLNSLNEVNWYGCASTCGGTPYAPDCICPACQSSVCLEGPFRNGHMNVAKTNYVRALKAMGVKAYSYQFDDIQGLKKCQWGANITVTLCPAKTGQRPWVAQYWQFNQGANQCSPQGEGTPAPGTYVSQYQCVTENAAYDFYTENGVTYCIPTTGGQFQGYQACAARLRPDGGGSSQLLLGGEKKVKGTGNWPVGPGLQSR